MLIKINDNHQVLLSSNCSFVVKARAKVFASIRPMFDITRVRFQADVFALLRLFISNDFVKSPLDIQYLAHAPRSIAIGLGRKF